MMMFGRTAIVLIFCVAILLCSLPGDAARRRWRKNKRPRLTKAPRQTEPHVTEPPRQTKPPRYTRPPVHVQYYKPPVLPKVNYTRQYPQYWYKRYSGNCNQDYYNRYLGYLRQFDGYWYNRSYPAYRLNDEQRRRWDSYGRYTYANPVGTPSVQKDRCCYTFNKNLLPRRSAQVPASVRTRQEYRTLTTAQRSAFHTALNALKSSPPLPSIYDMFVRIHRAIVSPHAHGGASFLPWHREFLLRFENALATKGYTHGLPYWDSTLDEQLPDPSASALWTPLYMGNIFGPVSSGPADDWPITLPECTFMGSTLRRQGISGWPGKCFLYSDFDIAYVFSKRCFRDITCNTDCKFEADHAGVHNFVGGHMSNPSCAPFDPIFFMHHAFVDCIWEEFRQNHQESNIYTEYPSQVNGDDVGTHDDPLGFEWYWPMTIAFPGVFNGHGIQAFYEAYYKCAGRPFHCSTHGHCKSSILWCNTNTGRCVAKVRQGGFCGSLPDAACAGPCPSPKNPKCVASVCICQTPSNNVIDEVFSSKIGSAVPAEVEVNVDGKKK